MDFFGAQDSARGRTTLLVVLLVLALVTLVGGLYALAIVALGGASGTASWWRPDVLMGTGALAGGSILVGGLVRHSQLSAGGEAVALSLGARRVVGGSAAGPRERVFLNVVEEMAIASGMPVPACYVMEDDGINAFAAGNTPSDSVIAVTRGALDRLTREELEGVVAHEFSHIANGDVRLNLRLVAVIAGLVALATVGEFVLRAAGRSSGSSRKGGEGKLVLALAGLAIMAAGFGGRLFAQLIQAAVSRQREFLADAAAVQYTRNPNGIAGALRKVALQGRRPLAAAQSDLQHLLFTPTSRWELVFATHPPLEERIRRILPVMAEGLDAAESPSAASSSPATAGLAAAAAAPAVPRPSDIPTDTGIQDAVRFRGALPPALAETAEDTVGALGLLFGLALVPDGPVRERQLAIIRGLVEGEVEREILRVAPLVAALPPGCRVAVLDLAVPALRSLSQPQRRQVLEALDACAAAGADGVLSLLLQGVGRRYLAEGPPPAAKAGEGALRLVLAAVIGASSQPAAEREAAHVRALALLRLAPEPAGRPFTLGDLRSALAGMRALPVPARRDFVRACGVAMLSDGRAEPAEVELVRAVADNLEISFATGLKAVG